MEMKKFAMAALAAMILPTPAFAAVELIKNGSFENNKVSDGTVGWIVYAGLADWSWQSRLDQYNFESNLTQVNSPGTADKFGTLAVYGPFPYTSPDGGDFIAADGDPKYNGLLWQTVSGLTVGEKYTLSFWQAAAQAKNKIGPTTEYWKVSFGGDVQYSDKFELEQAGIGDWEKQTMTFVAKQTSQVLSFLSEGTPGGQPPVVMLDGVSLTAYQPPVGTVPEPSTWAMMIMGFGAVAGVMRRRPRRAAVAE